MPPTDQPTKVQLQPRVLQVPSCSRRGGLVQGWESGCCGLGDSFNWKISKCLGFVVSSFLGFFVSSSQSFKASKFLSSKSSKIQQKTCFLIDIDPILAECSCMLPGRYWSYKISNKLFDRSLGFVGPCHSKSFQKLRVASSLYFPEHYFWKWFGIFLELFGLIWCVQR